MLSAGFHYQACKITHIFLNLQDERRFLIAEEVIYTSGSKMADCG